VVELVTEVSEGGEPVWRETSCYLRRERPQGSGGAVPGGAVPKDSGAPGAWQESDQATPGLHVSAVWQLPAGLGRSYAGVSGDVNPIHLSSWTARPLGFPRAIAHGLWSAAAVLGALQGRLPDAVRYDVQFRRPIPLPGAVRLLTAVAGDRIDAEVRGRPGDDQVHLTARVRRL
jgi:acyl dehydratase